MQQAQPKVTSTKPHKHKHGRHIQRLALGHKGDQLTLSKHTYHSTINTGGGLGSWCEGRWGGGGACIFNVINAQHGARGGEGDNKQSIM